ncbi:segregation/condensation protein B [Clostridium sp. K04]|jgi:segregation and condensation protein B|nr:segregation/condensation protein B [Clostridium sp. K04]
MRVFQIYLLRGGEILSNIDVKQYEFNELSRKSDIKSAIESMLFVSGEPLALRELSNNLELKEKNVEEILSEMANEYEDKSRGIRLISINGAYQLVTKSENSDFVQKLLKKNKKHSLSQASIESLAIIAYKQPITRIDIDEIRGVKSESAIARLIERGLIKDIGRLEVPGRPILYGTTDEFLRQFGLKTIKELPSLDLYSDEETQSSIDLLNKAIEDMEPEVDDFENNDNENNIEEEVAEEMNEAAIDEDK